MAWQPASPMAQAWRSNSPANNSSQTSERMVKSLSSSTPANNARPQTTMEVSPSMLQLPPSSTVAAVHAGVAMAAAGRPTPPTRATSMNSPSKRATMCARWCINARRLELPGSPRKGEASLFALRPRNNERARMAAAAHCPRAVRTATPTSREVRKVATRCGQKKRPEWCTRGVEGSGKRDSNSRLQPWQGCALPAELFPRGRARLRTRARVSIRKCTAPVAWPSGRAKVAGRPRGPSRR